MGLELEESIFIILTHQNYSFYAIDLESGENPPVLLFVDGDDPSKLEEKYEEFTGSIER